MDQNLVTDRLLLRPYIESDFEAFVKMHSDPILKANTHAYLLLKLDHYAFSQMLRNHSRCTAVEVAGLLPNSGPLSFALGVRLRNFPS